MKDNSSESGRQFFIPIILTGITIILGLISFHAVFPDYPFLRKLYYTFQLFTFESGDRLYEYGTPAIWISIVFNLARFLAIVTLISTIVLAILSVLRFKYYMRKVRYMKDHTILCGLGDIGKAITGNMPDKNRLIIIEKDVDNEYLIRLKKEGAKIIQANALDTEILKKVGIKRARYLLALTGNDFDNLTIINYALGQINDDRNGTGKITLLANIDSRNLKASVTEEWKNRKDKPAYKLKNDLEHYYSIASQMISEKGNEDTVPELKKKLETIKGQLLEYDPEKDDCKFDMGNVKLFNINQLAARYIFRNYPPDRFRNITKTTDPAMHVLILGYSQIGEELFRLLAQNCHFINREKTKITIVSLDGDIVEERILSKYKSIREIINLHIINHNPHHMTHSFIVQNEITDIDVIYICSGEDRFQASYSSRVSELFGNKISIIRPFYNSTVLSEAERINDTYSFNILNKISYIEYIVDELLDRKAVAVHNRWLKQAISDYIRKVEDCISGNRDIPELKPTLVPWPLVDEEIHDDNRSVVDYINIKLRSVGQLNNPDCYSNPENANINYDFLNDNLIVDQLAEMEHRRWMATKYLYGWEYGKPRDVSSKRHESMLNFDKLDPETQDYDRQQIKNMREIIELK